MTYHAKVITGGKIAIPAELRRELNIKDGDSLVIERAADGGMHLRTYGQVVKDVQRKFKARSSPDTAGSVVDELLADRRLEAAREQAHSEQWLQKREMP